MQLRKTNQFKGKIKPVFSSTQEGNAGFFTTYNVGSCKSYGLNIFSAIIVGLSTDYGFLLNLQHVPKLTTLLIMLISSIESSSSNEFPTIPISHMRKKQIVSSRYINTPLLIIVNPKRKFKKIPHLTQLP